MSVILHLFTQSVVLHTQEDKHITGSRKGAGSKYARDDLDDEVRCSMIARAGEGAFQHVLVHTEHREEGGA